MPRPTLKLTKPRDPAAGAKPASTRARLAQRERKRSVAHAEPVAPPPAPTPEPVAAPPPPRFDSPRDPRAAPRDPRASRGPRNGTPRAGAPRPPQGARRPGGKPGTKRPPGRPANERRPRPSEPVRVSRPAPAPRPTAVERPPRVERPAAPPPRDDEPRLSKRMGELGLCSRREADEWIENGWVRVNGKVEKALGVRVSRDAVIEVDPAATKHQREQVTIILHKPVGYVSGQPEDGHQSAVVLVKPDNHWSEDPSGIRFRPSHLRNLAPAGRLDIDSTGLLVYTQDGRVAKRLIGADSEVEKEYLVRVEGKLPEGGLERLRHGLELDGVKLKPAKVSWSNEDQLRFVLREGRKRQIRRMCEAVGLTVVGLKRVRTGGVPLGKLPAGQWRYLARGEKF